MDPEKWYQKYVLALPAKGAKLATAAYALGDNIPKAVAYFAKRARLVPVFRERLLEAKPGEAFEGLNESYTFDGSTKDGRFRLTDSDGVAHVFTAEEFTDRETAPSTRRSRP